MPISQLQYLEMLARTEGNRVRHAPILKAPDAVEQESDLHEQIICLCKARGWAYVHSRMDKRSTVGLGVPDFVVLADGGRVFFLEAKDRDGKLSTRQQAWIAQAKHNQHTVHVVRSITEVIDLTLQKQLPTNP